MDAKHARIQDCLSGVKAVTVISPGTGPRWLGLYLNFVCVYERWNGEDAIQSAKSVLA